MSGYLSFAYTGNPLIDAILSAVEDAGTAYHHTSQWTDDGYDGQPSCVETIEKAAKEAATALAGRLASPGAGAVERFYLRGDDSQSGGADLVPDPSGPWLRYTDHAAALAARDAEIAGLREELAATCNGYRRALYAKQARIDALMMEFCPGEMSADQKADWARNQKPAAAQQAEPTGGRGDE